MQYLLNLHDIQYNRFDKESDEIIEPLPYYDLNEKLIINVDTPLTIDILATELASHFDTKESVLVSGDDDEFNARLLLNHAIVHGKTIDDATYFLADCSFSVSELTPVTIDDIVENG